MSSDDRLRVHPHERVAGTAQHVDLGEAASRLRGELHASKDGHRQVAIARHGTRSILLFVFERDGVLKAHRADGEVTIHVLAGELEVTLETGPVSVRRGELLALASGETHSVRAVEGSEMLLTIARQAAPSSQA